MPLTNLFENKNPHGHCEGYSTVFIKGSYANPPDKSRPPIPQSQMLANDGLRLFRADSDKIWAKAKAETFVEKPDIVKRLAPLDLAMKPGQVREALHRDEPWESRLEDKIYKANPDSKHIIHKMTYHIIDRLDMALTRVDCYDSVVDACAAMFGSDGSQSADGRRFYVTVTDNVTLVSHAVAVVNSWSGSNKDSFFFDPNSGLWQSDDSKDISDKFKGDMAALGFPDNSEVIVYEVAKDKGED